MPDMTAREWYFAWATKIGLGVLAPFACWLVAYILARARAAVLYTQRVNSVVFAGEALRSTFSTLLLQYLILARFSDRDSAWAWQQDHEQRIRPAA